MTPVAVEMRLKTSCSVSVVATAICVPLIVKLPAVTVWAVRIEPIRSPETSDVELIPEVTPGAPTRLAAEASVLTLKAKLPTVPPVSELVAQAPVELVDAAVRC